MQVDHHREHLLNAAVAAGKFPESRRGHWRALYDHDPAGTAQVIAALTPAVGPNPTFGVTPYPRELFPELARQPSHMRFASRQADVGVAAVSFQSPPATRPSPAQAPLSVPSSSPAAIALPTAEQVSAWSRELFPEVAQPRVGPVIWAND
jgi:hypothetical protein